MDPEQVSWGEELVRILAGFLTFACISGGVIALLVAGAVNAGRAVEQRRRARYWKEIWK